MAASTLILWSSTAATAAGVIVQGGTPEAFGQMMDRELARWDAVRKAAGLEQR